MPWMLNKIHWFYIQNDNFTANIITPAEKLTTMKYDCTIPIFCICPSLFFADKIRLIKSQNFPLITNLRITGKNNPCWIIVISLDFLLFSFVSISFYIEVWSYLTCHWSTTALIVKMSRCHRLQTLSFCEFNWTHGKFDVPLTQHNTSQQTNWNIIKRHCFRHCCDRAWYVCSVWRWISETRAFFIHHLNVTHFLQ